MAMKYLGETYDIHTSSRELVFPHHENEIALAKALTRKNARQDSGSIVTGFWSAAKKWMKRTPGSHFRIYWKWVITGREITILADQRALPKAFDIFPGTG